MPTHEKPHLASKKFVAFLVLTGGLLTLMGLMIATQEVSDLAGNVAFMILAVTLGFIGVGYILGQASLDRYVRVALITSGRGDPGQSVDDKPPMNENISDE